MFCAKCPTAHPAVVRPPRSCEGACGELIQFYNRFCATCSNRTGRCEQCGHEETASEKDERHAYVAALVAQGKAAERDSNGNLPPKATHEIIGYDADGKPYVRRVKFS